MIPQILVILMAGLALGIAMVQHGKPKEGEHNFMITLVASVLNLALLWWGGFFNCFFGG